MVHVAACCVSPNWLAIELFGIFPCHVSVLFRSTSWLPCGHKCLVTVGTQVHCKRVVASILFNGSQFPPSAPPPPIMPTPHHRNISGRRQAQGKICKFVHYELERGYAGHKLRPTAVGSGAKVEADVIETSYEDLDLRRYQITADSGFCRLFTVLTLGRGLGFRRRRLS
jgi:hypothetical protein